MREAAGQIARNGWMAAFSPRFVLPPARARIDLRPKKCITGFHNFTPQMLFLVTISALAWLGVCLVPWRPWSTRERLEVGEKPPAHSRPSAACAPVRLCVLVPARNEAEGIARTLRGLANQDAALSVILIDDESTDGTADAAREAFPAERLTILRGGTPPEGWSGKLWALDQGLASAPACDCLLLLDADIELAPGLVEALARKLESEQLDLVSIMATLRMETFWEKLLAPAFVYFFKLLYPFTLSNSPRSRVAAAAGGCILIRRAMLEKIGAFASIRGALIDDCALARRVKVTGGKIWLGLSHAVRSHRAYPSLASLWNMVARNAFTQLRYSSGLLLLTTAAIAFVFLVPCLGFFVSSAAGRISAGIAILAMVSSYLPTLRYYGRSFLWAAALPFIGILYLAMTWSSALRYWRGERSQWKGRTYGSVVAG
jgi:hopene-associated glycosyltransferase HpnB